MCNKIIYINKTLHVIYSNKTSNKNDKINKYYGKLFGNFLA